MGRIRLKGGLLAQWLTSISSGVFLLLLLPPVLLHWCKSTRLTECSKCSRSKKSTPLFWVMGGWDWIQRVHKCQTASVFSFSLSSSDFSLSFVVFFFCCCIYCILPNLFYSCLSVCLQLLSIFCLICLQSFILSFSHAVSLLYPPPSICRCVIYPLVPYLCTCLPSLPPSLPLFLSGLARFSWRPLKLTVELLLMAILISKSTVANCNFQIDDKW